MSFALYILVTDVAEFSNSVQAYFFGISHDHPRTGAFMPAEATDWRKGLMGFAIPDFGIIFRSHLKGSLYEIQYAGLISLLKFIDNNRRHLEKFNFEVLTDSALIVYQINNKKHITRELESYCIAVWNYQAKIKFKISWVPREENAALICDLKSFPVNNDIKISFDTDNSSKLKELGKSHISLI
jgi:hypothetical protein